jgi:hypothetical protein
VGGRDEGSAAGHGEPAGRVERSRLTKILDAVDAYGLASQEYGSAFADGDLVRTGKAKDAAYIRVLGIVYDLED